MMLDRLSPPKGAVRKRKRIGRGNASGWGRNAGRGEKGQKSRAGSGVRPGFEGGQMPLQRRMPKRGFHNNFRIENRIVNLADIARLYKADEVVDAATLIDKGLLRTGKTPVKVLGDGELSFALTVKADKFSKTAVDKIKAAGGSVEVL
ncbi:MAG: 50S ribosomal protein L15 [Proteobacteria bacterium]|nr:50S ribosomal protein L15 [Pseudomonadota bacterium]